MSLSLIPPRDSNTSSTRISAANSLFWMNGTPLSPEAPCLFRPRSCLETGVRVSCAFDLEHYRELLEAAKAGGYRFAFFDREPRVGRADPAPRRRPLARRRAADGRGRARGRRAAATYFLMTRSGFYNLALAEGERGDRAPARARAPRRHSRGLAATSTSTGASIRWSRGTTRTRSTCGEPVEGLVNVMEAPWLTDVYRSDSNQHWRQGCPHEELAAGAFEWLQLLTHPEIWAYPGATMRESMLVVARRRARAAARAARRRPDRPVVRDLTVLLSASGSPGTAALRARSARTASARCGSSPPTWPSLASAATSATRSTLVPAGSDPASPTRCSRSARGERRRGAPAVVLRPRGARRARRTLRGHRRARRHARTRSTARTTRPRRTRCSSGSACRRRRSAASPGPQRSAAAARELGYPDVDGLLQAGLLVGLARLPRSSIRSADRPSSC